MVHSQQLYQKAVQSVVGMCFFFLFGCVHVCVRSDAFLKNPFFMQVTVVVNKLMVCLLISNWNGLESE